MPFISGGGGGGGASVAYESGYYLQSGSPTSIANGQTTALPFDDFAAGTAMLNISTPAHPLVLKAGLFIVSAQVVITSALTPGGSFELLLTLDYTGEAIAMGNGSVENFGICEVSNSWVMAAGAQFRLECVNLDGVAARSFQISNATVSRVGPA